MKEVHPRRQTSSEGRISLSRSAGDVDDWHGYYINK
jgi:hypothetical protein